jgi:uncharacterized protein
MLRRLISKQGRFFDLFNTHAALIAGAAAELAKLMQSFENREHHAKLIDEAEHAADRVTAETIRLLHRTFIPPLDRDHIHQLATTMDDVCDLIQDTTQSLTLYDIRRVTPEAVRLADIALKCCERMKDVVSLLGKDSEHDALLKTCHEIDQLESDADRVMRSAMSRLFREEQDAREIIKLRSIYELLEEITDRCEDVANLAEGISLQRS